MKNLSLKIGENTFQDTEKIISKIKKTETDTLMKRLNFIICLIKEKFFRSGWKRLFEDWLKKITLET